jgi:RluA family pseudouridine synthase
LKNGRSKTTRGNRDDRGSRAGHRDRDDRKRPPKRWQPGTFPGKPAGGRGGARPGTASPSAAGTDLPDPTIVFEDDDVLVIDKPAGVLSATPPSSDEPSAFNFVKRHTGPRPRKGPARAFIIHRLDRDASGLLVFAKNERAFRWLKEDFRAKRVHRLYLALVEGELRDPAGRLAEGAMQGFLHERPDGRVVSLPKQEFRESTRGQKPDEARLAVTYYTTLAVSEGRSLVQLRMETGRKHQIRVQLRALGNPVAGDQLYHAQTDPLRRLCLHAAELGFRHPRTGQSCEFVSPAPPEFWTLAGTQPPPGGTGAPYVRSEPHGQAREPGLGPARALASAAAPAAGPRRPAGADHPSHGPARPLTPPSTLDTSWDHVAQWYDELVGDQPSDHYRDVILPGAVRLLGDVRGARILDVACGQGILSRHLAELGARVTGVDASESLIAAARAHAGPQVEYVIADARAIGTLRHPKFDAATSVMALMNIDPLDPVLAGCAQALRPGGALVIVILHPAFRAPRQTAWGFETTRRTVIPGTRPGHGGTKGHAKVRQYRRVDGYLSAGQFEIVMNPGEAARGKPKVTTWTFHRPLQTYVKTLHAAGFVIEALEEWPSLRRSAPGPRATEENRARREIPLFLGMRAVLVAG